MISEHVYLKHHIDISDINTLLIINNVEGGHVRIIKSDFTLKIMSLFELTFLFSDNIVSEVSLPFTCQLKAPWCIQKAFCGQKPICNSATRGSFYLNH